MKRDLELIRKMVLAMEDSPHYLRHEFQGYTDAQIKYHVYLLIDAGMVKGDSNAGRIDNLTWAGHEFADAARDETRWRKALGIVQEKGGTVTIGVLTQLLVALMKGALGIP